MHWIDFHWLLRAELGRRPSPTWIVAGLFLFSAGLAPEARAQSAPDDSTRVQVRLHYESTIKSAELTLERGTLAVLLSSGEAPVLRLRTDETATLGRRQNDVYLRHEDAGVYAHSLHLTPTSGANWTLNVKRGPSHTYTGSLSLSPVDSADGLQLVNHPPLGDYVASVVASEYSLGTGEGAKAMAVVARTYALFTSKHPGSAYDHVDGTSSQVYRGVNVITEAAREAARQTRGEILTYEGEPIQAVYCASSGGHTANNEDVWTDSQPLPYLRGKNDPYDRASPYHRWSSRIDRKALLRALTLHQNASVEGFLLGDRTPDERLATLEVLLSNGSRSVIEAATFRSVVNQKVDGDPLKSTWFDARREGSEYVFEGRGYGHGVGLNQWGARTMARKGKSYREILSFYYSGARIRQLGTAQPSLAPPPVASDSSAVVPDSTTPRVGW